MGKTYPHAHQTQGPGPHPGESRLCYRSYDSLGVGQSQHLGFSPVFPSASQIPLISLSHTVGRSPTYEFPSTVPPLQPFPCKPNLV